MIASLPFLLSFPYTAFIYCAAASISICCLRCAFCFSAFSAASFIFLAVASIIALASALRFTAAGSTCGLALSARACASFNHSFPFLGACEGATVQRSLHPWPRYFQFFYYIFCASFILFVSGSKQRSAPTSPKLQGAWVSPPPEAAQRTPSARREATRRRRKPGPPTYT